MRATLLLFGVLLLPCNVWAQDTPPPDKARVRQLIEQLGDSSFAVREAAQRELSQIAEFAVIELLEAAGSSDLEQAKRAKVILGDAVAGVPTHRAVDALDQPIKAARVVIKHGGATRVGFTDLQGRFAIPDHDKPGRGQIVVDVRHPEYGSARWRSLFSPRSDVLIDCKLPLAPRGSEARKRAAQGKVVDGDGKPVVGAVLNCSHVRTQGEGLISGDPQTGDAITDAQGNFSFYLAAGKPYRGLKQHGDLVPPGSRYNLYITTPERDDCFPVDGMFSNDVPLEIRMPLAKRLHRFQFEDIDGPTKLNSVAIEFYPKEGDPNRVRLPAEEVVKGRKLIPGKYMATHYQNGKVVRYLPLRVAEDSPELLTFRLPGATVYRGRAVHGITGKPLPRVWAAATNANARNNLAELTDADWGALRAMPDVAGPNEAATKIVGAHYGIGALVRTDDEGRFEVTQPPGAEFYNIMVFAENHIPIAERVIDSKRGQAVDLGDVPLFPAAKIQVKLETAEKSLAISPEWKLEKDAQPDWVAKFRAATNGSRRTFVYTHWLPLNEARPVFIPSGVALRVEFRSPYDARWGSATTKVVRAEQGETIALGDVRLPKSLPVSVRVVDDEGRPLEGFAVRSSSVDQQVWTVAHNTDAKGLAYFFVPPDSAGRFRVDSPGPPQPGNIEMKFQIRDSAPESPFEIRLTAEQIRLIRSAAKK
jgi:hypothetical protein